MTGPQLTLLALMPAAYLVGSIPFGLIVGLSRGVDPRKAGSGNIGATNVGRLLGGRFFALVFILDMLKGLIPMLAGAFVLRGVEPAAATYLFWLGVGFACIAGHMHSIFLGFKGGKGVATSSGVILGLYPYYTLPGVVVAAVWGATFQRTRYVSVASMLAAACFPIAYLGIGLGMGWDVFGRQLPLLGFSLLVAILIVWKHRGNLVRLRQGTEHRFRRAG